MKLKRISCLLLALLMTLSALSGITVLPAAAEGSTDETPAVVHSYIRNGLYAWFSGEQNTREGSNTDSSVWHDIIGGHDLSITKNANNYFTAEGLHVKSAKHHFSEDIVSVVNGDAFTVEIEFGEFTSIGKDFNTFMNSSNDNFALFRRNSENVIEWKFGGGSVRPKIKDGLNNLNNHLLTVTYEYGEKVILYIDGVEQVRVDCGLYMGANDLFIGHSDALKDFEAVYKNIRFYTRSLSAAEVKHNAAVDGYADIKDIYVQEGLVSLYSGVSNTADGYDPDATVWTDLAGDNHLTLNRNKANFFTPEGFRVVGPDTTIHKFPQPIVDLVNSQEFSVELHFGDFKEVGTAYSTVLNSSNDSFALFRGVHDNRISFKYAANPAAERPFIDDGLNLLDNGVITITYKVGEKCRLYVDGTLMTETDCPKTMGANDLFIGQRMDVKTFDSTYKSIRFYNRVLTDEEVYANATADGVTAPTDENTDNPGYVTVAQPVTNIIGDVAMVRPVGSMSELDILMSSQSLPASALYEINKSLDVLDSEGKAFTTVGDALKKTEFKVLSCFYIQDKATADALAEYMASIRFTDFQIMSADKEVLKYAREKMTTSYGILDLRADYANVADLSEEQLLDIRRAVKTYNAYVAVLPVGLCRNEDVQYLYDRQVNVWAWGSDTPDVNEQYFALLSGASGIVSDATLQYLDVACNKLAANTMTRLPINIGHRGIPSKAPENCIEGAMYAYELGADVIEIDVYLTKDKQAVLMHDGTTGRTCNKDLSVEGSTLAELTALSCNKGFESNARFKDAKVPSLDDFLAAFKDTDVRFYIEIKSSGIELVRIVKELVEKYDMYGQCSVICFGTGVLANFRNIYPEMSVGALCMAYMNGDNPESEFRAAMQFIGKTNTTLNPRHTANGSTAYYEYEADDLRAAMIRGVQVHPWSFVGSATAYESHFMWGYAGLTGDNADSLRKIVRKVALPDGLTFTASRATSLRLIETNYGRTSFESQDFEVTVLTGEADVDGIRITPAKAGELTFIASAAYKIGRSKYTLYTQPLTVTVAEGEKTTEPADSDTAEPDTTVTEPVDTDPVETPTDTLPVETLPPEEITTAEDKTEGGCKSAVAGMIPVLAALGGALALLRRKRED